MTLDEQKDSDLKFDAATMADTLKKLEQGEQTATQMEQMLNAMDDKIDTLLSQLESFQKERDEAATAEDQK